MGICPDRAIYNQKSMDKALATLREQIAQEQKEYLDHWQDFYQDLYLDTYSDDVTDCVGRDLIAIARGGHEPNQVTKDAIEEARNRNDPR